MIGAGLILGLRPANERLCYSVTLGANGYNNGNRSDMIGAGMILGLRPANERRRYCVTTSLIGWAQA